MKNLVFFPVSTTERLMQPEHFYDVELTSPALRVMEDFSTHKPHMIKASESVVSARAALLATGVGHKLVVDDNYELVGIIDNMRLSSENAQLKRLDLGVSMGELTVRDLMRARDQIKAVGWEQVASARVGDLLFSCQQQGQEYALVVDREQQQIRGLIAAHAIGERLHEAVTIARKPTFVDIFTAVKAH